MSFELMARVNGRNAAFSPVGRRSRFAPESCSSLSIFVCDSPGNVLYHCVIDCGPGVPAEVLGPDRPFSRSVDAVLITHLHADHTYGLAALVEATRRASSDASRRLPVISTPETLDGLFDGTFSYLKQLVCPSPVTPGNPVELWREGGCILRATFVEVLHFLGSCVVGLELSQSGKPSSKVIALFDFNDFHAAGSPQAERGSFAANALFHEAQLIVASANTWREEYSGGRHTGHISCERLVEYLVSWVPERALLLHYSGYEDMRQDYETQAGRGQRMEPADGPVSDGEFNRRLHLLLNDRGYPDPFSVSLARQDDLVALSADIRPDEMFLRVSLGESGDLEAHGPVPRTVAHECGVMHTTVLVIPYRVVGDHAPAIAVHRRSPFKRVSPNKRDFAGGHVRYSGPIMERKNRANKDVLWQLTDETAVRETQQEIICDPPRQFMPADLCLVGKRGEFVTGLEHPGEGNIEASSVYCVNTGNARVTMRDTDSMGEHELEIEWLTLDELLAEYQKDPQDFADGAERVLSRLINPDTGKALRVELLEKMK